jgi:hypothetical protein
MKRFIKIYKILGIILFIIFLSCPRLISYICLFSYFMLWIIVNIYYKDK